MKRPLRRLSIERLNGVYEPFSDAFCVVRDKMPFDVQVAYMGGFRTKEEQFELYKSGRTFKNNIWVITDRGEVKTFADGERKVSKHQLGHAIDIVVYKPVFDNYGIIKKWDPDWSEANYAYFAHEFIKYAETIGMKLTWGGTWEHPDTPHTQIEL